MPLDAQTLPSIAAVRSPPNQRAVAVWLFAVAGMILAMVALGGATRLTGSGLSIMEWAPLRGTLPPLSEAEWTRLYDLYRQIPQYALQNAGFGLEGFKSIFWLEWAHRLWGRFIGLAFALPLAVFWWRGLIPRRLQGRMLLLLALGGLQGAVGWFMVASGFFPDATSVAPVRLVLHLGLALLLFAAVFWTALGEWRGMLPRPASGLGRALAGVTALLALTMLAGGFVAGLKAGLTYNTFPFMDGRLFPDGYRQHATLMGDWTANIAAVQFNHRLLATLTAMAVATVAAWGWRRAAGPERSALLALLAIVGTQYALGVATLLWVVPVGLGTLHQTVAVLLLAAALAALHFRIRTGDRHDSRP